MIISSVLANSTGYRRSHRLFAAPQVLNYCAETFRFLTFEKGAIQPYEPFSLFGLTITLFPVKHPPAFTCGVLLETDTSKVGYTSDTNIHIPEESLNILTGSHSRILDALVHRNFQFTNT